jgi:hypothetical protein
MTPKFRLSAVSTRWLLTNRVNATTIQTVGSKGYDGFLVALVGG